MDRVVEVSCGGKYYSGRIIRVTYEIVYDDGVTEKNVAEDRIRFDLLKAA